MALTERQLINSQLETMPMYGWRCGMFSLRAANSRHAANPEFVAGLRRGRLQRRARPDGLVSTATARILTLPHMQRLRSGVHDAYAAAAQAANGLAAMERAIDRGARLRGQAAMRERVSSMWAHYWALSNQYESERQRLLFLRGLDGGGL